MKYAPLVALMFGTVFLFAQPETPATAVAIPAIAARADAPSDATFVFYRPRRYVGSALKPSIYVNGEQMARLENGRFCVLHLKPGTYRIESSMKQDALEIEAKAGKVQFLEMIILPGNWRGGGRMIPTGESDGRTAAKKLKPLDKPEVMSKDIVFLIPDAA